MNDWISMASVVFSGIGSAAVAAALLYSVARSRDFKLNSVLATAELVVDLADTVASMMRHGQLHPSDEKAWETALRFWGRSLAVRLMVENDPTGGAWRESTLALLRNTDESGHPANEFEIREHGLDDEGSGKLAAHESSG